MSKAKTEKVKSTKKKADKIEAVEDVSSPVEAVEAGLGAEAIEAAVVSAIIGGQAPEITEVPAIVLPDGSIPDKPEIVEAIEVSMVIFKSSDLKDWVVVKPEDVPVWVTSSENVIKNLSEGNTAKEDGSDLWYIGRKSSTIGEVCGVKYNDED